MHSYGWIKDRYNPQAVYHRPKVLQLPDVVNLEQYLPDVRDQGSVGACSGFGIGGMCCAEAKQSKYWQEWYSPTYLYNGARFIEGTLSQDAGAAPEDVFTWLLQNGLLFEHFWPYNPNKVDTKAPGTTVMNEAIHYAGIQVIRVDNGLSGLLSALADGHTVAIGTAWSQRWDNPDSPIPSTGVLPDPNGSMVVGGHETFLHGYDSAAGYLFGQNSWGTSWGKAGRYLMPFSSIQWFLNNGGYDSHYVIWDDNPGPAPVPVHKCRLIDFFKKLGGQNG